MARRTQHQTPARIRRFILLLAVNPIDSCMTSSSLPSFTFHEGAGVPVPKVPAASCAPSFRFVNAEIPLCVVNGPEAFEAASATWQADCERLFGPSYELQVTRIAQQSSGEVAVRWRASWSPESTKWLEAVARVFRWEIERFDLDPREESRFSWNSVGGLFLRAATTRRLKLPCACVEGRSLLSIDERSGLVLQQRESIDVLDLAARNQLRNRKVAANVAEFLDVTRRPPEVDYDEWASAVASRVLSGVPGAGALDIEPLADGSEGTTALILFGLISAVAVSTSILTLGGATGVFGHSVCDAVAGDSPYWYDQCVSDLF